MVAAAEVPGCHPSPLCTPPSADQHMLHYLAPPMAPRDSCFPSFSSCLFLNHMFLDSSSSSKMWAFSKILALGPLILYVDPLSFGDFSFPFPITCQTPFSWVSQQGPQAWHTSNVTCTVSSPEFSIPHLLLLLTFSLLPITPLFSQSLRTKTLKSLPLLSALGCHVHFQVLSH